MAKIAKPVMMITLDGYPSEENMQKLRHQMDEHPLSEDYHVLIQAGGGKAEIMQGHSLRDYFAGQALNGLLSNEDMLSEMICKSEDNGLLAEKFVAHISYKHADAMLEMREKGGEL